MAYRNVEQLGPEDAVLAEQGSDIVRVKFKDLKQSVQPLPESIIDWNPRGREVLQELVLAKQPLPEGYFGTEIAENPNVIYSVYGTGHKYVHTRTTERFGTAVHGHSGYITGQAHQYLHFHVAAEFVKSELTVGFLNAEKPYAIDPDCYDFWFRIKDHKLTGSIDGVKFEHAVSRTAFDVLVEIDGIKKEVRIHVAKEVVFVGNLTTERLRLFTISKPAINASTECVLMSAVKPSWVLEKTLDLKEAKEFTLVVGTRFKPFNTVRMLASSFHAGQALNMGGIYRWLDNRFIPLTTNKGLLKEKPSSVVITEVLTAVERKFLSAEQLDALADRIIERMADNPPPALVDLIATRVLQQL